MIVDRDGEQVELPRAAQLSDEMLNHLLTAGRVERKHFSIWTYRRLLQCSAAHVARIFEHDEGHIRKVVRTMDGRLRKILSGAGAMH